MRTHKEEERQHHKAVWSGLLVPYILIIINGNGYCFRDEARRKKDGIICCQLVRQPYTLGENIRHSLLTWSAFIWFFLCILSDGKPYWFTHHGKSNITVIALMRWSLQNVFPGSLKPSRQCSCCPENTEIYIVCQVQATHLDIHFGEYPCRILRHNCHIEDYKIGICVLYHWETKSRVRLAGTYLHQLQFHQDLIL